MFEGAVYGARDLRVGASFLSGFGKGEFRKETSSVIIASLLAAARSRFGSCVINAIHYRNAASLPARRALPSLLGKVAAKPTDEATSRVQRKSFNEVN